MNMVKQSLYLICGHSTLKKRALAASDPARFGTNAHVHPAAAGYNVMIVSIYR